MRANLMQFLYSTAAVNSSDSIPNSTILSKIVTPDIMPLFSSFSSTSTMAGKSSQARRPWQTKTATSSTLVESTPPTSQSAQFARGIGDSGRTPMTRLRNNDDENDDATDDETDSMFDECHNDTGDTEILYNESDGNIEGEVKLSDNEEQPPPEYYLAEAANLDVKPLQQRR
jgi:hypothetical protein